MPDIQILKTSAGGYVILAPRRAKRPDESEHFTAVCPFCIGNEKQEPEVFRMGGKEGDDNWQVRVLQNKFPFAPVHEIIVHSPDHHKNFDELPLDQIQIIFEVFQQRYTVHQNKGTVFIFSNHGEAAGESLPHPHTQLIVLSKDINFVLPELTHPFGERGGFETKFFTIFVPMASQFPDEVWIAPKNRDKTFGQIAEIERNSLAFVLQRLIQIFSEKHGHEFPFNFYIYPWKHWYLRLIPREKKLGAVEIVSNIFINTQDPGETMNFIKERF